jgi:hypothetical protein
MQEIFLFTSVQTTSETFPTSYLIGTRGSFSSGKADHVTLSSAEVKMHKLHVIVVWYLIKIIYFHEYPKAASLQVRLPAIFINIKKHLTSFA